MALTESDPVFAQLVYLVNHCGYSKEYIIKTVFNYVATVSLSQKTIKVGVAKSVSGMNP